MATDTVLNELILQEVTQAEYGQLVKDNLLDENRVYLTPDNSLKGILLDFKWADHLLNDISWLRADTFSWHSGDFYIAAYNHLAEEFKATSKKYYAWRGTEVMLTFYTERETPLAGDIVYTTGITENEWIEHGVLVSDYDGSGYLYFSSGRLEVIRSESEDFVQASGFSSDTIGDTTITYHRAEDGHKICLPDQEDKLLELYNATGVAWYYILDTENKQFKLPRSKHNKYADTVPVVGNGKSIGLTDGEKEYTGGFDTYSGVGITSILANDEQVILPSTVSNITSYGSMTKKAWGVTTDSTKSGIIAQQEQDTDQYKYLYFYVGNFERDAVEQTAGITTETLNQKADKDLGNIPANYDYVVESQMPTAENGYTWYRKYKSGWVEQGGRIANNSTSTTVTLPVVMTDANYTLVGGLLNGTASASYEHMNFNNLTPTSFVFTTYDNYGVNWQVSGIAQ